VRLYRPSRSTMPAYAWGTIRTVCASTTRTANRKTAAMISVPNESFEHAASLRGLPDGEPWRYPPTATGVTPASASAAWAAASRASGTR
jgi:hypothetical protein